MANYNWPGWETIQLIGRGSFGAVYEIQRDNQGDLEKSALKVISIPQSHNDIEELYNDGYDDESIVSAFKSHLKSIIAEYTLMRKLSDCPNVVKCDDLRYEQHPDGIGWDIYIKMELLTPLTKALPATIPESTVVRIAKDMADALIMCQKQNVIHRDIKPQNIFVSPNGIYKLGDFGIAKTVEKTVGGTKIGTYKYMAPEVYNNQPYGSAADIYSLGLVLYWMLNDRRLPFMPAGAEKLTVGMDEEARQRRFSGEAIPAPIHGSAALKQLVLKACAFNPKDRFHSPEELRRALDDLNKPPKTERPKTEPPKEKSSSGSNPGKAPSLDIHTTLTITSQEATTGCTKTVQAEGVTVNVNVPAGIKDNATIRLAGAGKKDVYGHKGNMLIRILVDGAAPKPAVEDAPNTTYSVVVASARARSGTKVTITKADGSPLNVNVPAGCQDGKFLTINDNGKPVACKVYVHDFNRKTDLRKLPTPVLQMYANSKSGIMGKIMLSFLVWIIFGMSTMLIPVMAIGLTTCVVLSVVSGVKNQAVINQAQALLEQRKQ